MDIQEIGHRLKAIESTEAGAFANAHVIPYSQYAQPGTPTIAVVIIKFEGSHGAVFELRGEGLNWEAAFTDLDQKLKAHRAQRQTELAKRMALAIVEATYDEDKCTDRHLRLRGFKQAEILEFGNTAIAIANGMSAGGPYAIELSTNQFGEAA